MTVRFGDNAIPRHVLQVLKGRRDLSAALGARLLLDAEGLYKALLGKLDDSIPHSARYLADFEKVPFRRRERV